MSKIANGYIHYYIDENAGTVVAVMDHARAEARGYIGSMIRKHLEGHENVFPSFYNFEMLEKHAQKKVKDTYRGIAICSAADEFNVETGKEIARSRLLQHYYNDLWITINSVIDSYLGIVNALQKRKRPVIDSYMHWHRKVMEVKNNSDAEIETNFLKRYADKESVAVDDDFNTYPENEVEE